MLCRWSIGLHRNIRNQVKSYGRLRHGVASRIMEVTFMVTASTRRVGALRKQFVTSSSATSVTSNVFTPRLTDLLATQAFLFVRALPLRCLLSLGVMLGLRSNCFRDWLQLTNACSELHTLSGSYIIIFESISKNSNQLLKE